MKKEPLVTRSFVVPDGRLLPAGSTLTVSLDQDFWDWWDLRQQTAAAAGSVFDASRAQERRR